MSKLWSVCGFLCAVVSSITIVLAFSTPNWVESEDGKQISTELEKLGLWEFCFLGYSDLRDGFGRTYSGCWWLFAREYDAIREFLMPGWFVTTQALMTLVLVGCLIGIVLGLMLLINCFPLKFQKWVALCVCLGNYTFALLVAIALVYFGTNAGTSRSWLKFPHLRMLSWSFYCAVIGGIMALPAAMCYNVFFIQIRRASRSSTAHRAHELRYYR